MVPKNSKFIMIGTVRGDDDQMIVDNIKKKSQRIRYLRYN